MIKVVDLAWLEFEKPDLTRAEAFARAFGFHTAQRTARRTASARHRRRRAVRDPAPRPADSRSPAMAFRRRDEVDVLRLARPDEAAARALPEDHRRPRRRPDRSRAAFPVRVVAGMHELPELPGQQPHMFNFGHDTAAHQRHPAPAAGAGPGAATRAMWCCSRRSTSRR